MRSTGQTVWIQSVRAIVMIGVIGALCFSTGEGLRLTPLPALPLEDVGLFGISTVDTLSPETTGHVSGPLDRPAKGQIGKRGKRDTLECECPSSWCFTQFFFYSAQSSSVGPQVAYYSQLSDARPPGRAPPLVS